MREVEANSEEIEALHLYGHCRWQEWDRKMHSGLCYANLVTSPAESTASLTPHHLGSTRPPCDFVASVFPSYHANKDVVVPFPLKSLHSPPSLLNSSPFSSPLFCVYIHRKPLGKYPNLLASPSSSPKSKRLDLSRLGMASLSSSATILLLLLFLHVSFTISSSSSSTDASKAQKAQHLRKGSAIESGEEDGTAQNPTALKKKSILAGKNQTKILKPKKSNSTATIAAGGKTTNSTKIKVGKSLNATLKASNSTKPLKTIDLTKSNSTKLPKTVKLPKSNSTKSSKDQVKSLDSASNTTKSSKKSVPGSPIAKNKTASATKTPKAQQAINPPPPAKKPAKPKAKPQEPTTWLEADDDMDSTDLISDFRELPSRLLPDLERLSTTSKAYISAANKGIAEGVKPYVGKSVAPKVAPVLSTLFLALPLLLLSLLFRRLRSYLSLHLLLIFIQAYLAIYFATLALTALATGLEPLRFFYATSPASYTWTQAAQTMGYLVYLVLQLADLVAVFSSSKDTAASARALALAQMVIGLAVGMHYYAAVFHRAVSGEPPRANWRVHAVYAACFLVICACARAERRKKAYYEGGEDGKNS